MALKTCRNCGRKFSAARTRCPDCRRRHFENDDAEASRFTQVGVGVAVVLLVASGAYNLNRETGPPPELEALHSPSAAIEECRRGIATEPTVPAVRPGALDAEYLGGGEYEVRGAASSSGAGAATPASVLCEAQFRPETGWEVDVELDG